jgi:hypothetical protein
VKTYEFREVLMKYMRTLVICVILSTLIMTMSIACTPSTKLLFEDDFSNASSGWSTQSSTTGNGRYENGEFVVSLNATGGMAFGNPTKIKQISDFILEIDVKKLSDAAGGQYAIYFRSDGKNQYGIGFTDTGTYLINKSSQGVTSKLQDWKPSSDIKTGKETNKLKIICKGTLVEFYANDNKLTSINDDTLRNGIIILTVGSGDPSGARYSFDNFKLYSLE